MVSGSCRRLWKNSRLAQCVTVHIGVSRVEINIAKVVEVSFSILDQINWSKVLTQPISLPTLFKYPNEVNISYKYDPDSELQAKTLVYLDSVDSRVLLSPQNQTLVNLVSQRRVSPW